LSWPEQLADGLTLQVDAPTAAEAVATLTPSQPKRTAAKRTTPRKRAAKKTTKPKPNRSSTDV
jgi:hypothetical protein